MRPTLSVLTVLLAAAFAVPANAQTIEDFNKAEAALAESWAQLPLSFRNVHFVTEATGFGAYVERPEGAFAQGEDITVYAEAIGFDFAPTDDAQNGFGVTVDLKLSDAAGTVLSEKPDFLTLPLKSHSQNKEMYLSLSLSLKGPPAGDYVLEYTAHDLSSGETAVITMPFSLAAP